MRTRIIVASPQDELLYEVSPSDLFKASMREKINAEHSLTLVTTRHLEKEQRVLVQDTMGAWHEFVVMGTDKRHENHERPFGEYTCVWSLQHDLKLYKVDDIPGLDTPCNATTALRAVLSGTKRWTVGTVTVSTLAGADMTQTNGWAALSTLIANWGGEVEVGITVGNSGVTARTVSLRPKIGVQTAKRRFDYSKDLLSIRRKVDEMPVACRIRPYGKSHKNIDGIEVKLTIEEVNDGKDYIQNDNMVGLLRLPDGSGGWEYPTLDVENSSIDGDEELLEWGQSVLPDYTLPKVTYQSDVLQLTAAGMNVTGVSLGDLVQCVDRGFSDEGIRIETRVIQRDVDLLDEHNTELVMGDVTENYVMSIGSSMESMRSSIVDLTRGASSTADYLDHLLDHLNDEINATGGYTYIVEGHGIRTYDTAVSDPLVGAEASSVVEIKGGTIRIATLPKTSQGEWNWRTVFTAGHIAADMVTAAHITAGYIGRPDGMVYINLDNQAINFGGGATFGGSTVSEIAQNAADAAYERSAQELAEALLTVNEDIDAIQDQVDGNFTTWFYEVDPTNSNAPAKDWKTESEKKAHTGDMYYNTETGHSWRWVNENGNFHWQQITDSGVTKALQDAAKAQDTADSKRRVFIVQPTPPYDPGDLWVQGTTGDIMRCMTGRATGSYNASDWSFASKYTDDSALNDFLEGAYVEDLDAIRGQIDQKIETWYQPSDPSTGWSDAQKANHKGDLWHKTSDNTSWRYSGSGWVRQNAPDEVFDAIDGKAQIFVSQPYPPYNVGDLWTQGTSGDIMTCVTARASGSYTASDWQKRNKYTDNTELSNFIQGTFADEIDALQGQVDGKIETWYQSADPASSWTTADAKAKHKGDIWYRTTDSKTFRYSGSAWSEQEAPDAVFDAIDGKAQVFTSRPVPPYNLGDLWFDSISSDIMTCVSARATGSYAASDWQKRNKYTDDSGLSNWIQSTYSADMRSTQAAIDGKIETWSQANDPSQNWTQAQKSAHVGDLWYRTTDTTTLRYTGTDWVAQEAPQAVFDTIDGKAQVFVSTPVPPYNVGDLWFGEGSDILTCTTAKADGAEFAQTDWEKLNKYTDDSTLNYWLQNTYRLDRKEVLDSIDQKIETWSQSADPATAWKTTTERNAHKGDLWHRTTDNATLRYTGSAWVTQDAPDAVFDAIDGKAQVFVAQPKPPYNVGDLWFDSASSDIMTCITTRASGSYTDSDWEKRNKYTDDSGLSNFIQGAYADEIDELQGQIDGKIETWYQSADPSTAWTTTADKARHKGDVWYRTTDSVTLRYDGSTWVAQSAPKEVFDKIDGKAQVFTSTPKPPYHIGDLWFNSTSSDIMTCVVARASGDYVASDWQKRNKYTDDSSLNTFLNTYANDKSNIQGQIDGKIETWYQSGDPSTSWSTTDVKSKHVGDLWYKTTDNSTWRYNGSSWVAQSAPKAVFDAIDGKAKVFTSTPTIPYHAGDLWMQGTSGDIMTCITTRTSGSYTASDWAKRNKYTDDSGLTNWISNTYVNDKSNLQGQIDGKAETWYQSSDPSSAWTTSALKTQHVGDLWYRTTDKTTWRWSGSSWVQQEAPKAVFDAIDGKAQVFTATPVPPYHVGDLWFNSSTSDIMTCVQSRASGNYTSSDWAKRNKYTDDTSLSTFISGTYASDKSALQSQIDGKIETWSQSSDPSTGWTTTALKNQHKGDLWYKTTDKTTWRWSGTAWVKQDAPDEVFDAIDGKAQVFISTPTTPYHVGDLWFNSSTSDILTCVTARSSGSYASSDWAKRNKYTDDSGLTTWVANTYASDKSSLQGQIDGKAETWYQSEDPSSSWSSADKPKHTGDLWYKTSDSTTWRYDGSSWVQQNVPTSVFDKIDGKAQIFIAQPAPPYHVGDLWFNSSTSDIMTCIVARSSGSYTASDWAKRNKYTDDSSLNNWVANTYANDKTSLQGQIDGKAETWYQSGDPSTSWSTTDVKSKHTGDLWYKTGDSTTWRWSGSAWVQQNVPSAVFDKIDGKAQIFIAQPTVPYHVGDLWFNSSSSDIMTCITARSTGSYTASDWAKRNKYTDDSSLTSFINGSYAETISDVRGQIDQKAETWHQSADPSTAWTTAALKTQHKGDLWYKTTDKTTWRWSGSAWTRQNVPDEVFDEIDGKAQIFTSTPAPPYNTGDLWLNSSSSDIKVCVNSRSTGSYTASDWAKRDKYTDDTTANQAVSAAAAAAKTATNYLTYSSSNGLDVGYTGSSAKTRITGSGVEFFDGDGNSALRIVPSLLRMGKSGNAQILIDNDVQYISMKDPDSGDMFYVGWKKVSSGSIEVYEPRIQIGRGTKAGSSDQTALGKYNVIDYADKYALIVGNGSSGSRSNAFALTWDGKATLTKIDNKNAFTAADFIDCTAFRVNRCLNVAQLYLGVTLDAEVAAGGSIKLGTIPSGWRPVSSIRLCGNAVTRQVYVTNTGTVTLYTSAKISYGTSIIVSGTYLLPE